MRYIPSIFDVLDDAFDNEFTDNTMSTRANHLMKTDIHHKDGYNVLSVELPGYQKSDIKIELKSGYLTISAKHEFSDEEKSQFGKLIRSERSFGNVTRSYYVGEYVKSEQIKAKYENGLLIVSIPDEKHIQQSQPVISID